MQEWWNDFELGCKSSVEELAKYHKLTVLKVISHGICAQEAQLLAVGTSTYGKYKNKASTMSITFIKHSIQLVNKWKDVTSVSIFLLVWEI